ncbi:MAG TPA: polysaccharide pyruvyl transferase family protein [Solirubrobacterales bacterium]|nr:polysaccharide pyruvyl transferase family protein [Solirubrobacterales bacterium]
MVSSSAGPLVLVTEGWLANAGDGASYIATTRSLQRAMPGARVAISAHHRALVGGLYPELDLVPPLDALLGISFPWTSEEDIAERGLLEEVVEEADLILAAGGGYLLERYRPEARILGFEQMLERGKRLMLYSQSIGSFRDPALSARLQAVLQAAELVLVRDELSQEIVEGQRPADGVHLTADEAFLFPSVRGVARPHSLLVTASPHPWERGGDDELPEETYIADLATALSSLLTSKTARSITFASTAQGFGGELALEDDGLIAAAVLARVPAHLRNRISLHDGYLTPWQYAEVAARHTAAVSMRMHGAILAATAGTPVLMANASDKARELARRTDGGMPGIAERADLARLDQLVAPLLENPREARLRQNAAVDQMRSLARRNAELVSERLARGV